MATIQMGKKKINHFVLILLILIGSIPLLDLIYPAKLEGLSRTVPIITKLILDICLFVYFIRNNKTWWFKNSIGEVITVFLLIHITYLLFSSQSYTKDFYNISKVTIWYFGFFFFMDVGYRSNLSQKNVNRFFTIVTVLLFFLVFFGVTNEAFYATNRDYAASNFAYYLLFVLPFIFMSKNVPYRFLIFILVSIGVGISMKRGTMLMYTIMVQYLIFFSNLKGIVGKRFSKSFRVLVIVIILIVLNQFVFSNFDVFTDRFSDITEADVNNINKIGSGRGALYSLPLERWVNSNFFHFLFGYGFNATPLFYPTTGILNQKFYAHSDFVMLIHDYGFVGLLILVSFFTRLFKLVKKSVLKINKVPLFFLFIAFLIKALFSGFINFEYSIYGFAVLGLILGRQRRHKIENKYKNEQYI